MERLFPLLYAASLLLPEIAMPTPVSTIATSAPPAVSLPSERIQNIVSRAVTGTLEKFTARDLQSNQVAVTLIDLSDPSAPTHGSYRGEEQVYPASVIKLFYLVAAHHWMEQGQMQDTEELRRAMRDMIVDSYNEATGYIVDLLTGTTSGPELSAGEMAVWYEKRNAVNRYFSSLGYQKINVNRKPWCEGPYGREMQSTRMHAPNHRNWLTTDATARLMTEIVLGKAVTTRRCAEMMELLKREPFGDGNRNAQASSYTGAGLPQGARLWSKAGWTSQTRHDAAYVELPGGPKFVLVVFTVDHANEREIIPSLTREVVQGLTLK